MNSERLILDRPPRLQPELPAAEIEIPVPPKKEERGLERLIQVALPLVTIIGYVAIATLGGRGRSPLFMIPMALSVVASTLFSIYSYRKERQRQAEIERAYSERLVELSQEMREYHEQQRRFYFYNYPDRRKLISIVKNSRRDLQLKQRRLRTEARIYERRWEDDDFGVIRLGIGTLPSTVTYTLNEPENFEDKQVREALKLQEDSRFVSDIPVIVNLFKTDESSQLDEEEQESKTTTPNSHAIGIAGDIRSNYEYVRFLLAQYAVFHSPADAKLFVLAQRSHEWLWLKDLPHCQSSERGRYVCFVDTKQGSRSISPFSDEHGGNVEDFLEGLRSTLAQRKIRLQDRSQNEVGSDPRHPFLLVVIDLLDSIYDPLSPLSKLESDAAISMLLEDGPRLGATAIFLVPERSKIPSKCSAVIEIEQTTPATNSRSEKYQRLHFRYAEVGVNTYRYVGRADRIRDSKLSRALATELARVEVKQSYGANLATSLSFLELMDMESLSEVISQSKRWWTESVQPKNANWLRARFARMSGNKDRSLIFSAKKDGVHGIVAGSTGSGKSELLITMIISMAVLYNPRMLNFVLVDYKGGGAFKGVENLPHVVSLITNLEGHAVTRMFTAIRAELDRRQRVLKDVDAKNIVNYYRSGHHLAQSLPFLFIIVDEFAEMIADRTEYRNQLETITRIGRSLGVSLVLAAQNPEGVTDQMRSNIKFRICLRVETPAQSRELLRRTDAAFLPSFPGRGYLQVGNDEIELIQVAYSGGQYSEAESEIDNKPVVWPDRISGGVGTNEPQEFYKEIVSRLHKQSRVLNVPSQRAPWPEFLPKQLTLTQLLADLGESEGLHSGFNGERDMPITSMAYLRDVDWITLGRSRTDQLTLNPFLADWINEADMGWHAELDWDKYALCPVVGLVDDPHQASQIPLIVNLRQGHTVLYGASGWGKSTFVRSLVLSLAATHSPNDVHIYLLDLGGRAFTGLADLPHVGAVISPDEEGYEERVVQLIRVLDELVSDRKEFLGGHGLSDVYQYNRENPRSVQHSTVIVIDNFQEFNETFGGDPDDDTTVLSRFVSLARQSRPYGIHFVITASRPSVLGTQVASLVSEKMTLRLSDPSDYRMIVGASVDEIEEVPGRGYVRINRMPMAFQIALPSETRQASENSEVDSDYLTEIVTNMLDYVQKSNAKFLLPKPIRSLPQAKLLRHLLVEKHGLSPDRLSTQLVDCVRDQWERSINSEQADWLSVTLGVGFGDRPRTLHLEAKKDGVHGLIAGGTGSGKSELLMTMIVDLALHYDPSVLNFVLVDYKGGGAFKPFEKLPHCVDIVTNLNRSAVVRMFTAIKSEMQRRQKLNADTETKDIIEYRSKGFHEKIPYPHLFIIIDEYAEMISDTPEFRDELESITRVGRSLGVNLLLASQRPVGVTDQMRANIKYRICLRVEQIDTSREMLRRPDAAFLPGGLPGRGYLQVGNEHIELIQVAWTGDEFEQTTDKDGSHPQFFDYAVRIANQIVDERGGAHPATPWPPSLQPVITFSDTMPKRYVSSKEDQKLVDADANGNYQLNARLERWASGTSVEQSGESWLDSEKLDGWPALQWKENGVKAVVGIIDDPHNSRIRPLLIDLRRGNGIVFGGAGWGKTTLLRSLIMTLAATHSPRELNIHILDMGGRNFDVFRRLPHVGTVILPDERGYEERIQQLLRELHGIIERRRRSFSNAGVSDFDQYRQLADRDPEPAILLVLDAFVEFVETFGNRVDQDRPEEIFGSFISLARQGRTYGIYLYISASQVRSIPNKLYSLFTERLTLRLPDPADYSAIVGRNAEEIEPIPGRGLCRVGRRSLEFQVAVHPAAVKEIGADNVSVYREYIGGESALITKMADKMFSHLQKDTEPFVEPLAIDALPPSVLFRALLPSGDRFADDSELLKALANYVKNSWQHHLGKEAADWLSVPIGMVSGNRVRTISFNAQADGVHGLIAGGTGSGKSELLMTLIVGLALKYPPEILNFVLVDYKGGGAFKPFEDLPHCVDVVTNLNESAVDRMFTAISAELERRQFLNEETDTKSIVDYQRRGLHINHEPYPHLFVIIDEYAEMIDKNPDYRSELERVTRLGRALGVYLLLASQKPKGVTDQMRANIRLRICLRVEEQDTSREMLRRPDAALLPSGMPGRGYIQVGNENIELIQIAWTGENLNLPLDHEHPGEEQQGPKPFYAHAVNLTIDLWSNRFVPKPWPGFLPEDLSLGSEVTDSKSGKTSYLNARITDWLRGESVARHWSNLGWKSDAFVSTIGLVDKPSQAKQEALRLDFKRTHLAIFGDSGYGKTNLMRTLLIDLATSHSPADLHAYVVDLGGRNYGDLAELPQIGAIIYGDEPTFDERLDRLVDFLDRIQRERQHLLGTDDAFSIFEFNHKNPSNKLPAILVMIDNFAELQETKDVWVGTKLIPLVRNSLALGIAFVISANTPNNITGKLYNLFAQRITFNQTNRDRYAEIVGRGALDLANLPGRGYIRLDGQALQFQAAVPLPATDGEASATASSQESTQQIKGLGQSMKEVVLTLAIEQPALPKPISTLDTYISLEHILEEAGPSTGNRIQAVLGRNYADLSPALVDLDKLGPHFAVLGSPYSGRTTTLWTWLFGLAYRYSPSQVSFVLIDMRDKLIHYDGQSSLADLPHTLAILVDEEGIPELVERLNREAKALSGSEQKRQLFVIIDNYDDFADGLKGPGNQDNALAFLARRYGQDGIHFVAAGSMKSIGGTVELWRQIRSSNSYISLTPGDLSTSIPRELQNKEYSNGRGLLFKSGRPFELQIASLCPLPELSDTDDVVETNRRDALDRWVDRIVKKYPEHRAVWSNGDSFNVQSSTRPEQDPQLKEMLDVASQFMKLELDALKNHVGDQGPVDSLLTDYVATNGIHSLQDKDALQKLIRQKLTKVTASVVDLYDSYAFADFMLEAKAILEKQLQTSGNKA